MVTFSTLGSPNSPNAQPPRVKKISLEEAEQYRKDVLDPEFPEEREEIPLIHDQKCQNTPPSRIRKISRNESTNRSPKGSTSSSPSLSLFENV